MTRQGLSFWLGSGRWRSQPWPPGGMGFGPGNQGILDNVFWDSEPVSAKIS